MTIKILDPELVQQIAAGEVVEDPSSVVKELIENSLDAQATKIFIELGNGGKDLIRISDDGTGMSRNDALLAIKRHATSKINNVNDLFNIRSLGFRGEALASIASVSRFELVTKDENSEEGTRIKVDGTESIETVAANKGTTVVVKDLFYNTPARRKHLKLASTELSKCIDIITRYALSNQRVYFKVEHNSKIILNSPNTASVLNNLVDIYGKDIAKELLKVDYADNRYQIRGYISKPSLSRADKSNVSIFINGRYVRNKVISDALYDAYHTLLHHQRYPFAVLLITIDPKKLDVNIHPAKTKIKIEQEGKLYEMIFDVVRKTLQQGNLIPETDASLQTPSQSVLAKTEEKPKVKADFERKYSVEELKQVSLGEITEKAEEVVFSGGDLEDAELKEHPTPMQDKEETQYRFNVLGQLYKTYIVAEAKEGLMLIDQHAAHERVNFERLMKDYNANSQIKKQTLLTPVKLDLNPKDKSILEDKKDIIKALGFDFEEFGEDTYVLRAVPVVIGKQQEKTILLDVLDELISFQKSKSLDAVKEKIMATVACRSSIKAGDTLTMDRMNSLLKELFECDFSSNCPHGRPVIINISIEELEKRFKRRGF